tara:strand:+ start:119 stop:487 length:369 start_codon:yes stop_codon:yes gene_type:complete
VNSFNILKGNKKILSYVYLFLSILGAVLPMIANFEFAKEYGNNFDINNFIALANANPAAQSISRDLLVGASAIFIWIVNESKKLNMKNMWLVYVGTFLIAFAFAAPFFLFLRERRIIELEKD